MRKPRDCGLQRVHDGLSFAITLDSHGCHRTRTVQKMSVDELMDFIRKSSEMGLASGQQATNISFHFLIWPRHKRQPSRLVDYRQQPACVRRAANGSGGSGMRSAGEVIPKLRYLFRVLTHTIGNKLLPLLCSRIPYSLRRDIYRAAVSILPRRDFV